MYNDRRLVSPPKAPAVVMVTMLEDKSLNVERTARGKAQDLETG